MYSFADLQNNIENFSTNYQEDINQEKYFGYPMKSLLDSENRLYSKDNGNIAYFSMEYGLAPSIYNSFELRRPMSRKNQFFVHEVFSNYWMADYLFKVRINKMLDIPIYGGGLGVLAGDSIKSAADCAFPFVGIGILWNKGYFKQRFWYKHGQVPEELSWDPHSYPGLIPLKNRVVVPTKQGDLTLRLWKYFVYSYDHQTVCPLILLDSNVEENSPEFQRLTDQLYRSDVVWWKILQRYLLGVGGMKALKSLGYNIDQYHLNEGHAAFALAEKYVDLEDKNQMESLKHHFSYTCHTPVVAGHDRFALHDIQQIFPDAYVDAVKKYGLEKDNDQLINLTLMCLNFCEEINGVAQKHGEVTRLQFPDFAYKIKSITNGIHVHTWISDSISNVLDKYQSSFGDWRRDPSLLTKIEDLKSNNDFRLDLFEAHQVNKRSLVEALSKWKLDPNVLTVAWARRMAGYKRPSLILHNIERLVKLTDQFGPIQIILSGKAHPNDDIGSAHIQEILDRIDDLNKYRKNIKVLILENYDTFFGKFLTSSVDVWLNNPLPPFEASGTSGMKAILNGVLQFSTLDGWVVEAKDDDIGWIFGYEHEGSEIGDEKDSRMDEDSKALYDTLEKIMTMYYRANNKGVINAESPWIDKMMNCINRSAFFNTQRMVHEYNQQMWKKMVKEAK